MSLVIGHRDCFVHLEFYACNFLQVEYIFGLKPAIDMCNAFSSLTQRLAQAAGETFSDFPGEVEKDNGKTFVSDGNVHPLTTYVVSYINSLFM